MYKSPIDILVYDRQHQIEKQQDEEIYKAVMSVGINVDKEELIRALAYDRYQYMKGYTEGLEDATPRWIPVTERLPEKGVLVLCIGARGGMFLGGSPSLFSDGTAYFCVPNARSCRYATYWMPLPEPPKGE